jgi:Zn-dependent metalloprotease
MGMHRSAPGWIVRSLAVVLGVTSLLALTSERPTAAQQPDISLRQQTDCLAGDARSVRDLRTGALRFIGTEPGRAIPHPRPFDAAQSPEAAARAYLSVCGSLFGVQEQAAQLALTRNTPADGRRSVLRFQQLHQGIPIIGGELIVHLDHARNVLAVAGRALPTIALDTRPAIDGAMAAQTALEVVAKTHGLNIRALTTTVPVLSIYDPMMIGPESGSTTLVWRMDVVPRALLPIRELVLIDARRGSVTLHFNQVETARNRQTYTAGNATTLPGTLVCNESNPSCSGGDTHAIAAHLNAADTYTFFLDNHGRDSIDNAGMPITSTVHY